MIGEIARSKYRYAWVAMESFVGGGFWALVVSIGRDGVEVVEHQAAQAS